MGSTLKDLVLYFRSREDGVLLGAVQMINDQEAQRVVAAWMNFPVAWKAPKSKQPETDDRELWDWMWKGAEYDMNDLAERSGVDRFRIKGVMVRLIAARLIFPDGSIAGTASGVLKTEVFRATAAKLPKPKPAPKDEKKDDKKAGAGAKK